MKKSKVLEKEQKKRNIIDYGICILMLVLLIVHLTSTSVEMV